LVFHLSTIAMMHGPVSIRLMSLRAKWYADCVQHWDW